MALTLASFPDQDEEELYEVPQSATARVPRDSESTGNTVLQLGHYHGHGSGDLPFQGVLKPGWQVVLVVFRDLPQ